MSCMRQRSLILAAMLLIFIGACSSIYHQDPREQPSFSEPVAAPTSEMDDTMEFYDSVRKQPAADLGRVYDKTKQKFSQNKNNANRARLILLLTLPNTAFRDVPSALHLLNEWPRPDSASVQGFKALVTSLLAEQQRLHHNVEELSQKLKDEQKRVETLQSQIDAIKSMEKNLLQQL
jgi:hypothetical protein